MKWFRRTRPTAPGPAGEPEAPAIRLPADLYAEVARQASGLGLDPTRLANDLLREALQRRQLAGSVKARWQTLSPREREITRMAADGLSNAQIAARLFISPETVRNHRISAMHKLGLRCKAELRQALEGMQADEQISRRVANGTTGSFRTRKDPQ